MTDVALRFGAKDDGLNAQFTRTNKQLEDLQTKVGRASRVISANFGAIGAAAAAIGVGKLIGDITAFADELTKASLRTDITVESLQSMRFVAAQSDVEFNSVTEAISRLQNQLSRAGEGSKEAEKALARLSIPIHEFQILKPDEQFARVASAISTIENPADRTAAAMGLFGESGAKLLPILTATGEQLNTLEARFDAIGGPVSAATIGGIDDMGDSFGELKLSVVSLGAELLGLIDGPLTTLANRGSEFVGGLRILVTGGSDELVRLDNQIIETEKQIRRLADAKWVRGSQLDDLIILQARLDSLLLRQRELLGLNATPLVDLAIDVGNISLSQAATQGLSRIPRDTLTPQERRTDALGADNPLVVSKLEEKDLITEINQQMVDELLRQETEASFRRRQIGSDTAMFLADVRETFGLQEIEFETIKNQSIISIASGLFGVLARENSKIAKLQQGLAIAETIWSTSSAIMRAFAEVPYPLNFGIAAKIALQGAVNVAKIKSTNYNAGSASGGSVPSVGGAGGGSQVSTVSPPVPPQGAQTQPVTQVYITGYIGREQIDQLVGALRDEFDRDVVVIPTGSRQAIELQQAA